MRELFKSDVYAEDESGESIRVFRFESFEERCCFEDLTHEERCDYLGVFDDSGYEVPPGALYYTYSFDIIGGFLVMIEGVGYNV